MRIFIRKHTVSLILLIVITILVFSNTLKNSFIWDDKAIVAKGEYISKPDNIPFLLTPQYWKQFYLMLSRHHNQEERVNYRPIFMASFAFDYSLWKHNPFGYHLTNLLLHLLNVILIYFFISIITAPEIRHKGFLDLPFVSAFLFAIHPIHAESVTWIKNRSDLLALVFFLLSFIFFIKSGFQNKSKPRILFYYTSLLCFILALFSKSMAITLPLILGLYIICFVPREEYKGLLIKTLPFFVCKLLYIIFVLNVLGTVGLEGGIVRKISLYHNVLIVLKTAGWYLRLLVFPINLNADRPFSISGSFLEPGVFFSAILLVMLIVTAIKAFRYSKVTTFFLLWIVLTLIPISNIIFLASRPIAEQRLYIPSVGFCILLAMGICFIKRLTPALLIFLTMFYSYTLMERNLDWRDSITFWTETASASPNSCRAYNNLGTAYYDKELYQRAIDSYNKAIEVNPGFALTYNNMGVTYRDIGRDPDKAIASFEKAIELKPDYAEAYNNLGGLIYERLGQMDTAKELYKKAIEIDPDYAEVHFNLGLMHDLSDDYQKAEMYYKKTIELNPELGVRAYNNLAYLYIKNKRFNEAINLAKKALSIKPKSPKVLDTLGWAYYKKKAFDKAVEYLKKALVLLPDNTEIQGHLNKAIYESNIIEDHRENPIK